MGTAIGAANATRSFSGGTFSRGGGRAYVFFGGPAGLSESGYVEIEPDERLTGVGGQAVGGDFNGDGRPDLVLTSAIGPAARDAILWLGQPDGTLLEQTRIPGISTGNNENFGRVATSGDLDGDGCADLVIGASCAPSSGGFLGCGHGRAYVFLGRAVGLANTPDITLEGRAAARASFGGSMGVVDVDADGADDLIVGAACEEATLSGVLATCGVGYAYLYRGGSGGVSEGRRLCFTASTTQRARFSARIVTPGDMDADGVDVVLTAPGHEDPDRPGVMPGVVFGFRGQSDLSQWRAQATLAGPAEDGAGFGER